MDGFTPVSGDMRSFTSHVAAAAASSEACITRIAGLVLRTLTNPSVALTPPLSVAGAHLQANEK